MKWEIERAPRAPVRRTEDDRVAVPLQLSRDGAHTEDTDLVLSLVDAEHLHASLCRALDGHPAPSSAPDCRSLGAVEPIDVHRIVREEAR